MENGIEVVDKPRLEETPYVRNEASQSKDGERVGRGFHESKDSEGDDVFEEAIDALPEDIHTQDHPQAQHERLNSDKTDVIRGENGEGAHEASACSYGGQVSEKIEEGIHYPTEGQSCEKVHLIVDDKEVEGVGAAVPFDKVSVDNDFVKDETSEREVMIAELNQFDKDGASDIREADLDGSDAVSVPEMNHLTDDNETEGEIDFVVNKSENGDIHKIPSGEMPAVHEVLGDVHTIKKEADVMKYSQGYDTKEQMLCQVDHSGDLKETSAQLESRHQYDVIKDLKEASVQIGTEHKADHGSKVKGAPADLDEEHQDDERWELRDASTDLHATVDEETGTSEVKSPPQVVDSVATHNAKIKADEAELGSLECSDPQPQHGDKSVEAYRNENITEEPEEKEMIEKEVKNQSEMGREPEIQPVKGVGSSSRDSSVAAILSSRRPAGLGGAAPLLEPTSRAMHQPRVNGAVPLRQAQPTEDPINGEAEELDETREKLQMIRVKFLRLAHRLGQTPHNVVVAQVLYRLGLAEQLRGRNGGRVAAFSFDRASAMAEQLEAAGQEPLDFSCTIMVLGKTGVGKSATINSIFDEVKFSTDAFQLGTKKVQAVEGTVQGIKVRVIDTPGLLPSWSDQHQNEKILHSVKRFMKKNPPDIVLYLDRLDMQCRDFGDLPLLRTITEIFGASIWFNAIVVLTHAASAPPDGPNGTASSYDMFVTQRSHVVQQAIRQAAGDMRLMNPVSLVENHSACRTNRAGQRVLPNGQVWKPHLLLLSFASKILAEANTLLKLQDSPPGKPFATRSRSPPLPFLLSSLLQSRPQLKLPEEQFGDDDTLDDDVDEESDSDDESDYDELPPFKRLTKAQLAKLTKAQKKAYFDELEYREKLFMKKQLREEKKRRKLLKAMAGLAKDLPNEYADNVEEESGGAASVPVPMPDLALPISFDSDNPTHRYRQLDSSNQWLVRPVLETHGWDHDFGYEGINAERLFVVKGKIPVSFSGQVTKDKKESSLQMELSSSVKHGEGKATSLGFDLQTIGKDIAYTLRSETRFSNFRHNKTAAGLSLTVLGDAVAAGVKLEDKLIVNKRFRMVMTGGAMAGRGDVAYGGSLEATLRDKDYPLGRTLTTLGLSIMDWHGDLAVGCNIQSQLPVGRSTNMIVRSNFNNKGAGQVSIRFSSSDQLQIALIGLVPLFKKLLGYSQQMQFGQ